MSTTQIITMYVDENGDEVKKRFAKPNQEIVTNYGEETVYSLFNSFLNEIGFSEQIGIDHNIFSLNEKMPGVQIVEDGNLCISVMKNGKEVLPPVFMDGQLNKNSKGNEPHYLLKEINSVEKLKPFSLKGKNRIEYDFEEFFNLILNGVREAWVR
ncbi:hypothetical protein EB001_11765 [bacterium]|jgi:hypothetical protein|nr:hypothetical protein [bacterium]